MFFGLYFDIWYYLLGIILLPGIILSLIAESKVKRNFNKYSKQSISSGKTASQLARELLDKAGLHTVSINRCRGKLTDHYNPKTNTISLSESVFDSSSISAVGVMAHEVGHVLQHKDNYWPIKLRGWLVPVINFSNFLMWPLVILGLILEAFAYTSVGFALICVGIGIFALSTLFSLITLPVEKDASRRAYDLLTDNLIVDEEEGKGVLKVLNSACLTYVAALITSILSLLRFVLYIMSIRNRD